MTSPIVPDPFVVMIATASRMRYQQGLLRVFQSWFTAVRPVSPEVIETTYRAAVESLREDPIYSSNCHRVDARHWVFLHRYFNIYYRVWEAGRVVWLVDSSRPIMTAETATSERL